MTKQNETVRTSKANNNLGDAHFEQQAAARVLTAASIEADITLGLQHLGAAFHELEQRVVADNGKRYPLDAMLPDGVQTDGEIVDVNRFAFLQRQLVGAAVWKLENMLETSEKRIADQRAKIRSAVRDLSSGRIEESMVDRMADFLETLIDQQAMVLTAFNAAREAHVVVTGEEYETTAMRAERQRLTQQASPRSDRLARLGV